MLVKKYGVTTISRWLFEELPQGVKSYIEYQDVMLELLGVNGYNGTLKPVLRTLGEGRMLSRFTAQGRHLDLNTQVVLSLDEELSGKPWCQVSQQLRPSAPDCWTLARYLVQSANDEFDVNDSVVDSIYCG